MSRLTHLFHRRLSARDERADGHLLTAFLDEQDERAFAELLRRHGPLVWGVCRRFLVEPADAEDAFQATFLVLVRRADRLTGAITVGPWLFKVAGWTARALRRKDARRRARREPLPLAVPDRGAGPEAFDQSADLEAALLRLPEKYRVPIVLCYLQGWSQRDAAAHLGCPEGTLAARLSRGLAKLRTRGDGQNPVPALALLAVAVPDALIARTTRVALAVRAASLSIAAVSPTAADLAHGVLRMMWVRTLASGGLAAVIVLALGVGLWAGTRPATDTPVETRLPPPGAGTPQLPAGGIEPPLPPQPVPPPGVVTPPPASYGFEPLTPLVQDRKEVPPALKALADRLKGVLKTDCPDATVDIDGNELTIRYRVRKYVVHGSLKNGEFTEQTFEKEGPRVKGFRLQVSFHREKQLSALVIPQTLAEPYWLVYVNQYPVGSGADAGYVWVNLWYNRQVSAELLNKIKECLGAQER
ncbi:RNA polymerase sigma factor [Frigoriglobus tundricola]|uniref:Uncharacterized protein n=1 Tax=Frigoriglobus tundricola TaxID=2774151 RepID=A0A6M5Z524_9BACT|nr:sigma-70 family RNA polymerase sigma factor [Frigoriglobus tundricola]QJX00333.1 hypothetical protein FTUN_7959 [Frigoriglobus tundricola]